jgi:hypothetical protein
MKYVMSTTYFCTKWRLFINFLDCTHILSSQWYDSHIMFCTLSGSYCCFSFSSHMFWCWVETLFYLRKLSPEVKLIHIALLWRTGPTWSITSRLFLQALPWTLTKFLPLLQLPPLSFSCSSFSVLLFKLSSRIPIQTCFSVAEESFLIVCPTHFHSCTLQFWGESACFEEKVHVFSECR